MTVHWSPFNFFVDNNWFVNVSPMSFVLVFDKLGTSFVSPIVSVMQPNVADVAISVVDIANSVTDVDNSVTDVADATKLREWCP